MSEYLKDNRFLKQYAERTLKNLEVIEQKAIDEKDGAYEVTQLINSLLALIVFPQERKLPLKTNKDWCDTFRQYIVYPNDGNISRDNVLRQLRHSISHSHIFFEKDYSRDSDGNAQIKSIIFVSCEYVDGKSQCPKHSNCWCCKLKNNGSDKPDWQITIPVDELRNCVKNLVNEIVRSVDSQNKNYTYKEESIK